MQNTVWNMMVFMDVQADAMLNEGVSQYASTYFIYYEVSTTPTTFE